MTEEKKEPQAPQTKDLRDGEVQEEFLRANARLTRQAGSFPLDCGHTQVVSSFRATIAADGLEQHKVWCVDCDTWSRLAPRGE